MSTENIETITSYETEVEKLTAEKKAAGDARKALYKLTGLLQQNLSGLNLIPAISTLSDQLYDHIHELKTALQDLEQDDYADDCIGGELDF